MVKASDLAKELDSIARDAIHQAAPTDQVGELSGVESVDGVHTLRFTAHLDGYPGWEWVVTVSDGDGGELGVMEVHLLPGEGALLAPDWVPWEDRLEEYRRSEEEKAAVEAAEGDDDHDHDDDDIDDVDVDDLDGVDIDQLDLDPSALEVPEEPNDVFDHLEFEDD